MIITSFPNQKVKFIRKLEQKKYRQESGQFFIEGLRTVGEAVQTGAYIQSLVIAPELLVSEFGRSLPEHPAVKEVQVIGVPDERLSEAVMAYIILKEGMTCEVREIIDFCKPKMANFKIPKHVKFVDIFPLTPTGKIQKFKLREQAIKELHLDQ